MESSINNSGVSSLEKIKAEPSTEQITDNIMDHLPQENFDLEQSCLLDIPLDKDNCSEIMTERMDVREPLSTLRSLLEQKLGMTLLEYSFCLQNMQMLESHKNLVDQCVQGEGLVQINIQLKEKQKIINIVDVLKPADEYIDVTENKILTSSLENKNIVRWAIDEQYKKDQERLKIPSDPKEWTQTHVKHWLQWAVRQFNLVSLKLADWNITGAELCNLTHEEFKSKVPHDPGDIFWTHLELLKCKLVAIIQKNPSLPNTSSSPENQEKSKNTKVNKIRPSNINPFCNTASGFQSNAESLPLAQTTSNKTISAGQIQLWQFLLELLTDENHIHEIQWVGTEGEFKFNQPEVVAKLWGARKNKLSMNYEKLSRALRYYYDGDMISKVNGKCFVYKFVCDLKQLLGYSAEELGKLVNNHLYSD